MTMLLHESLVLFHDKFYPSFEYKIQFQLFYMVYQKMLFVNPNHNIQYLVHNLLNL